MPGKDKTYRIFISAAEPSADAHCGNLIAALKKTGFTIDFVGAGGPKMALAGCRLLENTVDRAAMAYKAFGHAFHFYKLIRQIKNFLESEKPDLVIVCDSPAFNFHIAKAAKKCGIKTLFYVAPQLWAWAAWRIEKLKKCCDKLCCLLPFEKEWFGQRGVDTIFVGNPLLDELPPDLNVNRKTYFDFKPQSAKIALMPGSRPAEIESLWRPMQQIAMRLKRKYPNVTFTTVAVDNKRVEVLKSTQVLGFRCKYDVGTVSNTARQCDFSIVASGSATLQVAAAGCPMAIMYQSSKILWHLVGRWLVKTKYLSLVNILAGPPFDRLRVVSKVEPLGAGRELVPEFMPYFSSIEPIVERIEKILEDKSGLSQLSGELIKLAEPMHRANASEKTAQIVTEMLA